MLFGPQPEEDEKPTTLSSSKKKKTRGRRNSGSVVATNEPKQATKRTGKLPTKDSPSNVTGSTCSTASLSSIGSMPMTTSTTAYATTTTIHSRRRESNHVLQANGNRPLSAKKMVTTPNPQTMYPTVWKALDFKKKTIPLASTTDRKPICVTGVDGFLASWIVAELLKKGYRVRGTVQNQQDDISGIWALKYADKNFTVVETSLLTPEACDLAVEGCDFVIHTGTPSSCSVRDPLSEQQEPGVHSIGSRMHCIIPMMTNFIQACARARIKRVVLTSSIAAMADAVTPQSIVNDTCWNITSSLERNPHFLSLKLAEEAAWQLVDQLPRECRIDLVAINPGTLFGPSLAKGRLAPGNQVIYDLITGQYSALVDLNWSMVDVRDCALAHIAALENMEARGRYICVNKTVWMKDIVDILSMNGYSGRDLPWKVGLPNWVARLPAYAPQLGQVGASLYANDPTATRSSPYLNDRAMDTLHVRFRQVDQTIVEAANDLLKWGLIKPWAEDHEAIECACCHLPFTFYRRKHHCRECGVIICGDCSMSRATVEGADGKVRLCDTCVRVSIPVLLDMLDDDSTDERRKAIVALESLMENELNHDFVTRSHGIPRLLAALHVKDESIAVHAAGALCALSANVSSSLQMVLEGAVLQMLEVDEASPTWAICLQGLRNIWKQINRDDFRRMLHAVARVSADVTIGELRGNILLTFVHMMEPKEVPSLLSEGLLPVLFHMLQAEQVFPRCAAAHAIKHLIPSSYAPDLTIDVPLYLVDDHEELFANSSLSDLQFLVKGHIAPINAHKVVLFFRNSYFKSMFGTATSQKAMIEVDNCSYEVFSILLRFLYTGKVTITSDIAEELLQASSFYRVYELQKRAEKFLSGEIRVENVVDLLCLADECNAVDLKKNCVPFLMQHIHDVVRLPAYKEHRIRASEEVLKALVGMLGTEWEASYARLMQEVTDGKAPGNRVGSRKPAFVNHRNLRKPSDAESTTTASIASPSPASFSNSGSMVEPLACGATTVTTVTAQVAAAASVHSADAPFSALDHLSYAKALGHEDGFFRRSRGLSDDLSEAIYLPVIYLAHDWLKMQHCHRFSGLSLSSQY